MEFDKSETSSEMDMLRGESIDSRSSIALSVTPSNVEENSEFIQIEKEILEQQKPRKPVARILPAFIDLIILGAQAGIWFGFLYMAYIYGNLHNTNCFADSYSEFPLLDSDMLGINVTKRFSIAIRWGFWMSTLNVLRAILAQVSLSLKNWMMLYGSYVMFACNFTLILILFIFMNIWRWDHPGRVCAGDYLTNVEKDSAKGVYLITEGKFLKVVLVIIYCILGLGCYSVCFIAIFLSKKKTQEQISAETGMFKTKQNPVYEVNITQSRIDDRSYSQGQLDEEARKSLLSQK